MFCDRVRLQEKGLVFAHTHHAVEDVLLAVLVTDVALKLTPCDVVVNVDDQSVHDHRVDAADLELQVDQVV